MNPIFARITKVDEERREVTGRATQEILDRDGEVMDYFSSKPNFQKWSAEVYADSGGKSLGNLRSMHGAVAAGKLTAIDFNDAERAVDITARIVDDAEWRKCQEGIFTGFSIGGHYTRKWQDMSSGKPITRYTAAPSEISLVDRPACPSAKIFSVHKKNGVIEKRRFITKAQALRQAFARYQAALEKYNGGRPVDTSVIAIRKIHGAGPRLQVPR